jgi:hypothetical protein
VPCLVGCLAVASPRLALFLVWLLGGDYLSRAFEYWLWPLLGFFFMPLTTLAFAYGMNSLGQPREMEPLGWLLVAVAGAIDIGLIGGSRKSAQQWQRSRDDRERY